jgi:hypothetical protein
MRRPRLRFSVRTMIVAVAIAAVSIGCLVGFLRSEGWLRRPIELAPPPRWANTDHDIFDIALTDLIENKEFGIVGGGTVPRKFQMLIGHRTYGPLTTRRLEAALADHVKDVPAEIVADLVHRNPERNGYSLARYQPSNPDIVVEDTDGLPLMVDFERLFPKARGCVLPFLPGYSRDGHMSLFFFACEPSLHGAAGYYLLRKVNGRWEIILKGFYATPHES